MSNGHKVFDRAVCKICGRCVEECYAGSLEQTGKIMSVHEVLTEVEKDRPFYETSGGGVTFSGGEPLLQSGFIEALLCESRKRNLSTVVDSAFNVSWKIVQRLRSSVDLFLIDIKTLDDGLHRRITGVGNTRILGNLKKIADGKNRIWIRIPVIPKVVNDEEDQIEALADFLQRLKRVEIVELLPFNRLGESKYTSLGMECKAQDLQAPSNELMDRLNKVLEVRNIPTPEIKQK
jgi:pyruvate formate lyase activating enzyme